MKTTQEQPESSYYYKAYRIEKYQGKYFVIGDDSDNGVFDTDKLAEQWIDENGTGTDEFEA